LFSSVLALLESAVPGLLVLAKVVFSAILTFRGMLEDFRQVLFSFCQTF
jgi:hypothetical protein